MAYVFSPESRIQIEVHPDDGIAIWDYELEDSGDGDAQLVCFSRQRLPLIIAALQEIQADFDAGRYDTKKPATPEA